MRVKNHRLTLLFLLAVLGVGVFGVYGPGLDGPFLFDDYPNIVGNQLVAVDALDVENLRDAWPNITIEYMRRRFPYKDQQFLDRFLAALQKAGLPG